MDAKCDSNHLDSDVLLPPRKRLLAGLKRQSCSESTSQCSREKNPSPSLSPSPSPSPSPTPSPSSPIPWSEFDIRLNNLLKSYKNGSNMSPEEIAEAAGSAAVAAAKAAEAARAAAEVKAAIAAEAVTAAKGLLDLVASISEDTGSWDRNLRKNKLKKQVPVQQLYKQYQSVENCVIDGGRDEELARRLHQVMNSSPRISKHLPGSNSKDHKRKKLKISLPNQRSGIANGIGVNDGSGKLPSAFSGDATRTGIDYEGSNGDSHTIKVDDRVSKSSKHYELEVDSGEAGSHLSKENRTKASEDMCINVRKRGRIRQKKLPLSVCSFKDQTNPKEELNLTNSLLTRVRVDKSTVRHVSLFSVEPSTDNVTPIEVSSKWKCQDFKVPQCIKPDKAVQS